MYKEINFGTAVKLGKTLELSWHNTRSNRWKVSRVGDDFYFEDEQKEWPTTVTTIANIKFWVLDVPVQPKVTTQSKDPLQDAINNAKGKK